MIKTILRYDVEWSRRLRLDQTGSRWFKLAAFLAHSGDSWFWMVGLIILWLFTQGAWRATAVLMAGGVGGLACLVLAIKFTIRRQRPPGDWGAIYRNTDPHSFPSGHAARAAMLAVLAIALGPAWFAWVVALWAPLVSAARVATGVHYLTDIIAGILVGILAGLFVLAIAPWLATLLPFLF